MLKLIKKLLYAKPVMVRHHIFALLNHIGDFIYSIDVAKENYIKKLEDGTVIEYVVDKDNQKIVITIYDNRNDRIEAITNITIEQNGNRLTIKSDFVDGIMWVEDIFQYYDKQGQYNDIECQKGFISHLELFNRRDKLEGTLNIYNKDGEVVYKKIDENIRNNDTQNFGL